MLRSEDDTTHTTVDLGPAKEIQHSDDFQKPAQASPVQKEKKKLQFHMASKIQIIPDNRQGQLNTGFLATIPGVLKIAEIVGFFLLREIPLIDTGHAKRPSTDDAIDHVTFAKQSMFTAQASRFVTSGKTKQSVMRLDGNN
ncbi:hypothetical protein TELCIR_21585 [Teladorsagia circumcincta]|uniref:Uncharacterized protein n=1 Tax=Teladorsagia circumcincta TaxID=45464 RepID=A0A2G9THJ7_TELCI|nr:hypothetical protein TELCIR_21585 [Teladorsagia circumcincta]